jgi:epoxyqueuosine reductase QueG
MSADDLSILLHETARNLRSYLAGIATLETLAGRHSSILHRYFRQRSPQSASGWLWIRTRLKLPKKEEFEEHNLNKIHASPLANGIALEMSNFLNQIDFKSIPVCSNLQYRNSRDSKYSDRKPLISQRYLAARFGIGVFCYSGHIITRDYGYSIIL